MSKRPFWWPEFKWPTTQSLVAAGLFALSWRVVEMLSANPGLSDNQGFMFVAQAIIVSGLVSGVVAFFFGASKATADDKAAKPGPPVSATATTPGGATVSASAGEEATS